MRADRSLLQFLLWRKYCIKIFSNPESMRIIGKTYFFEFVQTERHFSLWKICNLPSTMESPSTRRTSGQPDAYSSKSDQDSTSRVNWIFWYSVPWKRKQQHLKKNRQNKCMKWKNLSTLKHLLVNVRKFCKIYKTSRMYLSEYSFKLIFV